MANSKIIWQVGEYPKHSIPDGAKVTFVHKIKDVLSETTFWLEDGELKLRRPKETKHDDSHEKIMSIRNAIKDLGEDFSDRDLLSEFDIIRFIDFNTKIDEIIKELQDREEG